MTLQDRMDDFARAKREFRTQLAYVIAPWLKPKTVAERQAEWASFFEESLRHISDGLDPDGNPIPLAPSVQYPWPRSVRLSDLHEGQRLRTVPYGKVPPENSGQFPTPKDIADGLVTTWDEDGNLKPVEPPP